MYSIENVPLFCFLVVIRFTSLGQVRSGNPVSPGELLARGYFVVPRTNLST